MFDLLDEPPPGALGPRPALKLKEDAHGRVFLAGLSEVRPVAAARALASPSSCSLSATRHGLPIHLTQATSCIC